MNPAKSLSLVADFFRTTAAYLSDSGRRNRIRAAVDEGVGTRAQRSAVRRESDAVPDAAQAFRGLTPTSLALAVIHPETGAGRHLNVLVPELGAGQPFAGISTVLVVAQALADELSIPLRFLVVNPGASRNDLDRARAIVSERFEITYPVVPREKFATTRFATDDLWLATHWTTAHAVQVGCVVGSIDPSRVLYLVQDYEPDFLAASSDAAIASATYHAGFLPMVNSVPVWETLNNREGLDIDGAQVMAPQFDLPELRGAAEARQTSDVTRVLFYARPSKPRNMYPLGLAVLRATARALGPQYPVEFVSAGEKHRDMPLAWSHRLVSLGRLSRAEYFRTLAGVDVVLSLQQSAHPSHPPFDAAISGATAITNDWDGTRAALHPRIRAVSADVSALSDALAEAVRAARTGAAGRYSPPHDGALGHSLSEVVADIARRMPSRY